MLWEATIVGLIGIFAMFDSRLLGRLNFERPLIVCTLVGLALGDLQKGLMVGAALELVSMGLVQVGAAVPPDMVLGSTVAAAFAILSNTNAETALTVALPVAVLGQLAAIVIRMFFSTFTHMADHAIDEGKFKKVRSFHIVYGPIIYSLLYFIPIFLSIYLGTDFVKTIVNVIPDWLTNGLNLASKILPAYGFALLMSTMIDKKNAFYLFIGFFISAYAKLSVTGVAIFAILLAFLINELMAKPGNSGGNGGSNDSSSKDNDSEDIDDLEDLEEL